MGGQVGGLPVDLVLNLKNIIIQLRMELVLSLAIMNLRSMQRLVRCR